MWWGSGLPGLDCVRAIRGGIGYKELMSPRSLLPLSSIIHSDNLETLIFKGNLKNDHTLLLFDRFFYLDDLLPQGSLPNPFFPFATRRYAYMCGSPTVPAPEEHYFKKNSFTAFSNAVTELAPEDIGFCLVEEFLYFRFDDSLGSLDANHGYQLPLPSAPNYPRVRCTWQTRLAWLTGQPGLHGTW